MTKFKVLLMTAATLATSAQADPLNFDTGRRPTFTDSGWNVRFYDNAGFPVPGGAHPSVAWQEEDGQRFLQFYLKPGDMGTSASDTKERSRAPYWERAEVKQVSAFEDGKDYVTSFRFRMVEGWQGGRETFMQIHGYTGACNAKPALMVKMDQGKLDIRIRRKSLKGHDNKANAKVMAKDLIGTWNTMETTVRLSPEQPTISMTLNGKTIVDETPLYKEDCAALHHKFGIYRPGGPENQAASRIDFAQWSVTDVTK